MKTSLTKLPLILAILVLATLNAHYSRVSAQNIQPIYSFPLGPAGPNGLIQGLDGNFYGTTGEGGSSDNGTVFKAMTNGVLTTLYSFSAVNYNSGTNSDGANPGAGLTLGPDGNFYGTTSGGGSSSWGTFFKITTNGAFTTVASFTYANPDAGLTLGPDGNFYGTTSQGGSSDNGTVFEVTTNGILTALYSFSAAIYDGSSTLYTNTDGTWSYSGLTWGPDGNFYGTAFLGGSSGWGTVFRVSMKGILTTLYSFTGGNDGGEPSALTLGADGNFYGTTYLRGNSGNGTVFKVTANGVLTTLDSFDGTNGANPEAGLTLGPDGNLCGTTTQGGSNGIGTVFEVMTNGVLTVLASLPDDGVGNYPFPGALTLGSDGNFYGTTQDGGSDGYGSVFEATTNGVVTTLVNFVSVAAAHPYAGLTPGANGNFYGTTGGGGGSDNGTVFEVTTNGVLTTLANIGGVGPVSWGYADKGGIGLTLGPDGNLYGTTPEGGSSGDGTVFQVTTNGALTTLVSFPVTNGFIPYSSLTLGPDGNLFGTTAGGFTGLVFEMTTNGALTALASIFGDGDPPLANGLTLGPDGNFYGTTQNGGSGSGTVFEVTTNGALTTIYSFAGGGTPNDLTLGPDGNFYGTTVYGGNGNGSVFKVTTSGLLTSLYSFNAGNFNNNNNVTNSDGAYPYASLTLGPGGKFYGTTSQGGSSGAGTVFEVTTSGILTTLATFTYTNGANPYSGLTVAPDGNFYGTTSQGGVGGGGIIYRLDTSPPTIGNEPAGETLPIGDTAHFQVSATGSVPLHYQWYFNTNNALAIGTNANLAISAAITNDDGYYQVIVTNYFGSATSDVAFLSVIVEPNMAGISNNPSGGTTTLSMGSYPGSTNYLYATTDLLLPLSQWQLVASNVAAANGLFQFIDTHTKGVPARFYFLSTRFITPAISIGSVSPVAAEQTQAITISGHGFGTQSSYNGDSDYLYLLDVTGNWEAGYLPPENDVTLNVTSWTDNQIVISGFTGYYGYGPPFNWFLEPGDNLTIAVWNPQTGVGPAIYSVTVGSP